MQLTRKIFWFILMLALGALLLACQEDDPTPEPTESIDATATSRPTDSAPTATSAPTETAVPPTPTMEPTPLVAALDVSEQILTDEGTLIVDRVVSPQPVWVLVSTTGENSVVLGQVALPAGVSEDIVIELDPYMATITLQVALFSDLGETMVFEEAIDLPLEVTQDVAISLDVPLPSIIVSEQEVPQDGFLLVDAVIAVQDGWLAIFSDVEGESGELMAFVAVEAGLNEALPLTINRFEATADLHAVLYADEGEVGRFEPEVDPVVNIAGEPVDVAFTVTLPLDLLIFDQIPFEDQIVIERVVVPIDAFVAVYFDDDGQLGRVIGFAPVAAGVNENVVVEIQGNLATPTLFLAIHRDVAAPGEFDFPGDDSLLAVDGQIPAPFTVRTNPGNYMVTTDQPLAEDGTIKVPLILVDTAAWVVVYEDVAGELGEVVGVLGVPAGFLRDVTVSLEGAVPGNIYHIVLHIDNAEVGVFEPPTAEDPTGVDIPFQRNRQVIRAPFRLLDQ